MAEQLRRNAGGSQPISQHPLFPAIVALWFGALFGLGSIAIRPAVIEHAVLAMGLDSIIPMAAPPLGTTTRILIALLMTGLGGVLGALIARRLARPAPEVHERRRGAVAMAGSAPFAQDEPFAAEAAPPAAAPTAAPTAPAPKSSGPMAPGRRRSLAILETEPTDHAGDIAVLAGHTSGILNVAEFDLDGFEHGDVPTRRDTGPFDPFAADVGAEALVEAEDLPVVGAAQVWIDQADTAPDTAAAKVAAGALGNRLFETYSRELSRSSALAPAPAPAMSAPMSAPITPAATPAPVAEDAPEPGFKLLPRLNVADWSEDRGDEDHGTAVAQPEFPARPLFEQRVPEAQPEMQVSEPEAPAFVPIMSDERQDDETHWDQAATGNFADDLAAVASPSDAGPRRAVHRIVAAQLDELSPIELLERLALAMAQRREEARLATAAPVVAPVLAPVVTDMPVAAQTDTQPEQPAPFLAPEAPVFEAPVFEAPASVVRARAFEPLAFRPVGLDEAPVENRWEPEVDAPVDAPIVQADPVAVRYVPAALRPVGFGAAGFEANAEEEEDGALPGYIPPRHIGLSRNANAIDDGAIDDGAIDEDDDAEDHLAEFAFDDAHEDDDGEEAITLEQGYSSLLDLSRPVAARHQFVRIEEPEDAGEIQPVVIFPGEETREAGPFARPVPAPAPVPVAHAPQPATTQPAASTLAAERLFDAPGRNDPVETERALRAALATLQRMSGAA